ncbi:S1C family serine protease [Planctomicrobium sp. SH664]|uniref:S1C family serine protease n=1 Tax=Planctomicrobium sp. SH664 TaxID=3448125 RepID=UPI003F5B85E3
MALLIAIAPISAAGEESPKNSSSMRDSQRTQIVAQAMRSSVNIHTEKRQKSMDVVFSTGKAAKINGMGTGIVIDERGYIVTNFHVVQDVERLRVTTFAGMEYEARTIEVDSREDLAIIKIEPREPLTVAKFGTSSDLMLGEDVIAIGNAYGYESTVTRGIISHRSRDVEVNEEQSYRNLIQIDAAINPGNSGGPLINADGEVIGINVAIRAGAQRIGFAIPIDSARKIMARLMNIERHNNTYHGIATNDVKMARERKLVVQALRNDSPALAAGLKEGDVILRSGAVTVVDAADFERSLFGKMAGTDIPLLIRRGGEELSLSLRLTQLNPTRQQPGQHTLPSPSNTTFVSQVTPPQDKAWDVLGLKLVKLNEKLPPGLDYEGGMKVVSVRPQSLAETNGIREGDILVGLHIWATVSEENVQWVLSNPQLPSYSPLKFYIVRDGDRMYGHFHATATASR